MRLSLCLIAAINLGIVTTANANEFLNRARQSYESMTPSQRAEIESAVAIGRQINLGPETRKEVSGGQPLAFLNGMTCKDWGKSDEFVRRTWLTRYLDAVDTTKNGVAYVYEKSEILLKVDSLCSAKRSQPVEVALAETFRIFEADLITKREQARIKSAEARERLEAKKDAAAAEKRKPENNPLLNSSRDILACRQWTANQNDVDLRQHYLQQYKKERFPEHSVPESMWRRATALCFSYPDMLVVNAVDFLFGQEPSSSFSANNSTVPAMLSWKSKLQQASATLKISAIDNIGVENDQQTVEVQPGLHAVQYSCTTSNSKYSRSNEFFLKVTPNAEYAVLATTFPSDGIIAPHTMHQGESYQTRPNVAGYSGSGTPTCGVLVYECPGRLYINKAKTLMTCEADKLSSVKALFEGARWVLD